MQKYRSDACATYLCAFQFKDNMMNEIDLPQLKEKWQILVKRLSEQFDEEPDLQTILFLVGVQELGKGPQNFSKSQKMELMHIATCRLLSQWGYYELEGSDADGWPHWKKTSTIPVLSLQQQDQLLKQSVIQYFEETGLII